MFERYTEVARRCIFFARHEASVLGTSSITAEELLVGILREDKRIAMRLPSGAVDSIRMEIHERVTREGERVPTSVDMPVSPEAQRAMMFAAEEADALRHERIDTQHLILGLMRVEESSVPELLRRYGLTYEQYREAAREERAPVTTTQDFQQLIENSAARLRGFPEAFGDQGLYSRSWTKKEALGHLIDWAIAHERWVAEAALAPRVEASGFPEEAAVAAQDYAQFPWLDTVDLWASMNRLLIHTLSLVPETKRSVPCQIGSEAPVPLEILMERYFEYCRDMMGRVLARF